VRNINIIDGVDCRICETPDEARILAQNARLKDPLEKIKPSLLNKHDIVKYVSETGMIFPFSPGSLKPASYEVAVGNKAVYWDDKGEKKELVNLKNKEIIPLKRNSITFVDVDITFFLPYYIAARFNLTITHVHRGLLLGTGPLVDPGFCGKIMIPIHNLTNNDYEIESGEPLITVEFTKLTPDELLESKPHVEAWYKKNLNKNDFTFSDYFKRALPLGIGKVESSLSGTLAEARKQISSFEAFRNIAIIGSIAIFVAIAALVITSVGVVSDANKNISDVANNKSYEPMDLSSYSRKEDIEGLKKQISVVNAKIKSIDDGQNTYWTTIKDLQKQLTNINAKLDSIIQQDSSTPPQKEPSGEN
jgi:deoxycytidine triphosphate deaminase